MPWRAALLSRANQAPVGMRDPLIWRGHQVGSVAPKVSDALLIGPQAAASDLIVLQMVQGKTLL